MSEHRFSLMQIFLYKDNVYDSVLAQDNISQRKPLFFHTGKYCIVYLFKIWSELDIPITTLTLWCVLQSLTTGQGTRPPTIQKLDLDHNFFVKIKCTTSENDISTSYYKHIKLKSMLFCDFSAKFFVNLNFGIFLENYHKIAWTATTHSSHHVKATAF